MTAKIDIKKTSRLTQDRNGYRAERVAIVTGITGNADALLFNAMNDAALPDIGDSHPEISGITLQSMKSEPLGGGNYRIIMSYFSDIGSNVGSENARFVATATTSNEEVYRDINDNIMQTEYSVGGAIVSQYFTAEIERPRLSWQFTYTATDFPQYELDNYLGAINSVPWLGYAAETIMCSDIRVSDDGLNFRVVFSFQHNAEGWQFKAQVAYHFNTINAHPTRPDADLDLDTGTKVYPIYALADFTPLGFNFAGALNFGANAGRIALSSPDVTLTVA